MPVLRRFAVAAALFALALLAPAAARAVDLDQCANGPVDAPMSCVGAAWVSTPLTPADSHYLEGDSVPYAAELHELRTSGSHTVEFEYDTTEASGRHAFDYLTSFDRTETTAVPCHDAGVCSGEPSDTFPIPADPSLVLAVPAVTQSAGSIAIWNGDITDVAYVRGPAADTASPEGPGLVTAIRITFTADSSEALIAFGAHLASPLDWGVGKTAGAVFGTPYNLRAVAWNNLTFNVSRSLTASPLPLGEPDVVQAPQPPPPPPEVFLPPQSTPVLGETIDVAPVKGEVLVQVKGKKRFVPLRKLRRIPVGSTVDARNGSAKLTSATNRRGGTQTATFYRGTFTVLQRIGALTTIELTGGDFDECRTTQARRAPAGAQRAGKPVRGLWGTGKGRFRTRGRYSSATVRGTVWFVQDRCDGTLTRVRTGTVEVLDFDRDETVTLNAGDTYLAERPR